MTGRRPRLLFGGAAILVVAVGVAVVIADGGEDNAHPRAEPDAQTLREATLAGPSGSMSEALRSGLSSMRCEVAYRVGATTEERTVEIGLDYGGGGEMLHFDDAAIQIMYQDLEAYAPMLYIDAGTKPAGSPLSGQPEPPRIDVDRLSPGDVVEVATLTHPSSGSTINYSCSVQ